MATARWVGAQEENAGVLRSTPASKDRSPGTPASAPVEMTAWLGGVGQTLGSQPLA